MKKYVVAAIAALLLGSSASAEIRIFNFTARVDQLDVFVPTGTMVMGTFSYDDAIVPTQYFDGEFAIYSHPSITISASFAGLTISGNGGALVSNSDPNAEGGEDSFSISKFDGSVFYDLSIWQPDRNWLTDTRLPVLFPSPLWQGPFVDPNDDDDVIVPHGEFSFWNAQSQGFSAVVLSVAPASATAVPEPAAWIMMIAGFGLAGAAIRRRRKDTLLAQSA